MFEPQTVCNGLFGYFNTQYYRYLWLQKCRKITILHRPRQCRLTCRYCRYTCQPCGLHLLSLWATFTDTIDHTWRVMNYTCHHYGLHLASSWVISAPTPGQIYRHSRLHLRLPVPTNLPMPASYSWVACSSASAWYATKTFRFTTLICETKFFRLVHDGLFVFAILR